MQAQSRPRAGALAAAIVRAALTGAALLAAAGALAQVSAPLDQLPRPRDEPLPTLPQVPPKPPIVLPPPAARPPNAISSGVRVAVRGFRFEGNTAFTGEALEKVLAPFAGRTLDTAELEDARLAVTRHYIEAGFINSGALLPDQDVTDGIVVLRVIEGRLGEIAIGGAQGFNVDRLRDRIALGATPPLNVNALQERMQLLLQDPAIERLSAELAPGAERGEAVLRVDVAAAKRFLAGFAASNDRSPAVGADQLEGFISARNLFGYGDTLTLRAAATEGVGDWSGAFALPLNAHGTLFTLRHGHTRSRIVETPLNELGLGARSVSTEFGLAHPLIESLTRTLTASATYARRSTLSLLFGQPSPLVPNAADGRTTVSALRFALDGVARSPESVAAARMMVSNGIGNFGGTIAGAGGEGTPDSRFTSLLVQTQYVRRLPYDSQLVLRADGQTASDALLGPEKYSLGGMDSVRGYRRDALVRDRGFFASIEGRILVANLALRSAPLPGEGALRLAAFADYGRAGEKTGPDTSLRALASIGSGLRWDLAPGVDFALYYGVALRDLTTPTRSSWADRGIHLRFTFTQAF